MYTYICAHMCIGPPMCAHARMHPHPHTHTHTHAGCYLETYRQIDDHYKNTLVSIKMAF